MERRDARVFGAGQACEGSRPLWQLFRLARHQIRPDHFRLAVNGFKCVGGHHPYRRDRRLELVHESLRRVPVSLTAGSSRSSPRNIENRSASRRPTAPLTVPKVWPLEVFRELSAVNRLIVAGEDGPVEIERPHSFSSRDFTREAKVPPSS